MHAHNKVNVQNIMMFNMTIICNICDFLAMIFLRIIESLHNINFFLCFPWPWELKVGGRKYTSF